MLKDYKKARERDQSLSKEEKKKTKAATIWSSKIQKSTRR